MIMTLNKRSVITISSEIRKKLGIGPGDALDARVEKGRLILEPVNVVPRTLTLSGSGAKKEALADEDIRRKRVKHFDNAREFRKELDEDRKN